MMRAWTRRIGPAVLLAGLAAGAARPAAAQIMDTRTYSLVMFQELEYQRVGTENPIRWDALAWVGGDFTRLWLKSEGSWATVGGAGEGEIQVLYGRLIAPYWDLQAGARLDVRRGGGKDRVRGLAVLGLEGLAPYWFELEPTLFVSHQGDISARVTASYDLFVTQRIIAQPRLEANAAVQQVPDFLVGSGLNDVNLGVRLLYGIRRQYAPYLGIDWTRRVAQTARLARAAGEPVDALALVGGLRLWF